MSYTGKIKIDTDEFPVAATLYGTCSSLASATEKAVVLANFDALIEGVTVAVKFVYSNTATDPTLNVNGTGAKPIYKFGTTPPGETAVDSWNANSIVSFVYDGTSWMMLDVNPDYNTVVNNIITAAMLRAYPVGSIYMSVTSTSPATLFGGSWERIQDRFLLAAGSSYSAGGTGGAATVTLTTSQIPAHTHGSRSLVGKIIDRSTSSDNYFITNHPSEGGIVSHVKNGYSTVVPNLQEATNSSAKLNLMTINATHTHDSVGGSGSHNNMPPYLTVYVWKRTA